MLLNVLLDVDPATRRAHTAPGTSLGDLADGLARELSAWLPHGLPMPEQKARLTRLGGRCPVHAIALDFDPASPHAHRCARCERAYTDPEHHQWWAMGAQLFTAERVVHASALYLLRGDVAHRDLAIRTLGELADRYSQWPNRDNVLGPTRPFFSTYLESLWLLNICHAISLLEQAGERAVGGQVRDRIIAPSSTLIASYHEGRSNRQVWNEVAILSSLTLLGEPDRALRRAQSDTSLLALMRHGLLEDGTWFEGENYHQFAHRGLWYGMQWLQCVGYDAPAPLAARFHEGFVTPFAGLLPDETLPSRRDSQYAVSVRQWRWAEWCELGYARTRDPRLAAMLATLYDGRAPHGDTGRSRSTGDAERNMPAGALSRADLSWRALLMADPMPAPYAAWHPQSVVQPRQGLAVLRRESARVYVALEGGQSGGGHGHPDRLSLTLQTDGDRWLDDPGTGSYVERTLHWYRSTLAHHAPLVDGASQRPGETVLEAFEDRGGAGWVRKHVPDLAPGVQATRSIVVCDGYLVDLLEWSADREVTFTLPVATGNVSNVDDWQVAQRVGAGSLEAGYDFLQQVDVAANAPSTVCIDAVATGARSNHNTARSMRAWYAVSGPAEWWRGIAPGAPGCTPSPRVMVDCTGTHGRIVGVWSWSSDVNGDIMADEVTVTTAAAPFATVRTHDGTTAAHEPAAHGWHIGLLARQSRSSIDLEGLITPSGDSETSTSQRKLTPTVSAFYDVPRVASIDDLEAHGLHWKLGAEHYVPTEEPWGIGNTPEATVMLGATASHFVVHVSATIGRDAVVPLTDDPQVMPANPLDNENADVNADGVQCYIGVVGAATGEWQTGVLAVPLVNGDARCTSLVPSGPTPIVTSKRHATGWELTLVWHRDALPPAPFSFDVVVNERPPSRERRRGQLVLSGGGGFGYLRGDRHAPDAVMRIRLL